MTDHAKNLAEVLRNSRDALHGFLALTVGDSQANETVIIKQIDEALAAHDAMPKAENADITKQDLADCIVALSRKSKTERAEKIGGSYQAKGTIVSRFKNTKGEDRVVFEFDEPAGMLHIFNLGQIALPQPLKLKPDNCEAMRVGDDWNCDRCAFRWPAIETWPRRCRAL